MERYKAFLSEIKRENEKIGRKIRFVNHKSKFQPVNGKKVGYNKFFVNSYEVEKKNNLCKYYKHKIDRSRGKKKGKIHNDGFPFFEVYKNTNPAFKNNLPQYGLLQMLKSYDELELFQFCSRRKEGINFFTPLLSHFIEIVIRKRDLYRISDVLLLTEHIKKLNYYHPYFCKLVCREVCLDIHKIKTVHQVTRFLDFLMHFNIFNHYYVKKFYKYVTRLITHGNRWTLLVDRLDSTSQEEPVLDGSQAGDPHGNDTHANAPHGNDTHANAPHANAPHANAPHANAPHGNAPHGSPIQIHPDDVASLCMSFTKYKMIDAELLLLLLYLCRHEAYTHLRNPQTLHHLTQLSPFYRFVHGPYSSEVFPYIYKQVLEATPRGGSNFVPLLKSFYTISKEFGTALDVDLHNATLEIYGHTGGAQGGLSGGGVSPPSYVLSGGSRKKGKKARSGGGGGNANANGSENANANTNGSANTNCVDRRAGGENPFAPFNCDANSNLKRLNLGDEALAGAHHEEEEHYDERHYEEHHHEEHYDWLPSEGLPSEKAFRDLVDTVKHVVLLIELKLLSAFPFAREKGPAEIEFVKRVNFHADREKSVHKYNALNVSAEQRALVQRLLRRNGQPQPQKQQQDGQSQPQMQQQDGQTQQRDGQTKPQTQPLPPPQGHHFDDSELNFLFYRNYGDEPGTATMGDINAFLKSKPDVKFNLTDGTYFAHVFSHLWQVQGCQKGRVTKNKYGYSTTEKHTENDALYKMLSEILVKKIINIKSERLYKVILSCGNTAYSDVYLNHFLKKFNRHVKFRKMRKYINC
ncbi:hypothetical protein PVMG_01282 [Plasmodium vivax Mauritania I]|uniref:Uncharacterized protein n=1 Tax=Plasmodium vivax Mauritania I TaxID=1035515 RepID=A0A0J9TC84_PLAVI|nr:hypothetical protein PVMG_01282 [Plasmodium vivax Mauritania I]